MRVVFPLGIRLIASRGLIARRRYWEAAAVALVFGEVYPKGARFFGPLQLRLEALSGRSTRGGCGRLGNRQEGGLQILKGDGV